MTATRYELWREDDNGQRFLVSRYPDRESAEQRLAELSCTAHKQTYWIDELPEALKRRTDR